MMENIPPETITAERCVIVINQDLPLGNIANAAAVLALTLGQRHPRLVGEVLADSHGQCWPGLIPIGISVLAASEEQLGALLKQPRAAEVDRILFPADGQQTTHYAEFLASIANRPSDEWRLLGIALVGEKKTVRKLTAKLNLLA
ncbi:MULTISPECIES: DUF2000 domain-containing protein [unclassified Serratia (in: enterobacteria)]|uniref:DUF2000 domain-containing protein n=1 Tax=unclassified Serratia (in: enterobacteria) TaxID=2647522 RepID=UPI002ED11AD1|nr:DUF2000 domain-containing protein [Serratia sp. C2(2)]MEE4446763.1 DUF2000 domain-containing protein [Serratia sp. C2(1)]